MADKFKCSCGNNEYSIEEGFIGGFFEKPRAIVKVRCNKCGNENYDLEKAIGGQV